jgi:hypothetical protein
MRSTTSTNVKPPQRDSRAAIIESTLDLTRVLEAVPLTQTPQFLRRGYVEPTAIIALLASVKRIICMFPDLMNRT